MFRRALVTALFAVNFANGFFTMSNADDTEVGMPGALQIFLDVKSVQTLLQDVSAFAPYYALDKISVNPDLDITLAGIDFKLNQVNVTDVTIGKTTMEFVGTTDTIRTTWTNTNITLAIDAEATDKILPTLDITELFLQGVTLQLDLAISTDDGIKWQVVNPSDLLVLSLEDFELTVAQPFWQKQMDKLKPEAKKVIDYGLKFVTGVVAGLVDAFNVALANETANTFVFDISPLGVDVPMPFNLTMSKAPEFSNEKGEIMLHIDGDFDSADMRDYVPEDKTWAPYEDQKQREQIWIHQSTINTALYDLQKTLSGEGFESQIFLLLAELKEYYGADVTCDGTLTFPKEQHSQPIRMTTAEGILIGDGSQGGLRLTLDIKCAKDASTEKELAVVLNTGLSLRANVTWDDFEFWAELDDPMFYNTVAESKVADLVLDYHNWDMELMYVVKDITEDFNLRWATPHDFKAEYPLIKMVAGLVRKTLLSPFVADEFLFAGFKMITDV